MSTITPSAGTNLAILVGTVSRPPEARGLPDGSEVLGIELSVRPAGGAAESVPVSWPNAPASANHLGAGQEVLVVGRVRRRFFRAGGITQSRTEVVAADVVPTRKAAAASRAAAAALAELRAGFPS